MSGKCALWFWWAVRTKFVTGRPRRWWTGKSLRQHQSLHSLVPRPELDANVTACPSSSCQGKVSVTLPLSALFWLQVGVCALAVVNVLSVFCRSEDPIKFIATYMLENNPNRRWLWFLTLTQITKQTDKQTSYFDCDSLSLSILNMSLNPTFN